MSSTPGRPPKCRLKIESRLIERPITFFDTVLDVVALGGAFPNVARKLDMNLSGQTALKGGVVVDQRHELLDCFGKGFACDRGADERLFGVGHKCGKKPAYLTGAQPGGLLLELRQWRRIGRGVVISGHLASVGIDGAGAQSEDNGPTRLRRDMRCTFHILEVVVGNGSV